MVVFSPIQKGTQKWTEQRVIKSLRKSLGTIPSQRAQRALPLTVGVFQTIRIYFEVRILELWALQTLERKETI